MQAYLDNAATTPLDAEVILAMQAFMETHYGNPSSVHTKGREARVEIEKARKKIASLVGCKDKEIIFTSGGTEANNAILKANASNEKIKRIISSPIEHHSILDTLKWIEENTEVEIVFLSVDSKGNINLQELEELLVQKGASSLVSLMHANNEIGNLLDLNVVGELCHNYNALFHTDMVQTLGHLQIELNNLPLDFATASAHKLHGPKGIGFIYTNSQTAKMEGYLHGGSQERGVRGGTENGSGIIGMSKAYELACASIDHFQAHTLSLKVHVIEQLNVLAPSILFNGNSASLQLSLSNIINLKLPCPYDDIMLFNLDLQGVYISEGSACSSGASDGSHVINALEKDKDICNNVRLSFSKLTTLGELDYAINKIANLIA